MSPRLRSIELQGYKTFANRVTFEFPMPITAIVGPNGSGKSNIADAIRWVLGEQSFSLLRGHKTMDMIFSGSEKKPRASMASATITFDNSDHWLPIDYGEVAVTRRAYRDGQNEYLINGQKVRLKDVNELLARSGLSERTYTVIGQGLIDNALSARPDDRRKFFEEAAGIGLFHSRREEAVERLEATHHNMERIGDILSELEPRVRSLERQAKRAAEYNRITGELKELLREWYGYHWHKSQNDLLLLRERYETQKGRTLQVRGQLAFLEKNVRTAQEDVNRTRLDLSDLHARSAEVQRNLDRINKENAVLEERITAARNQISAFGDEAASLEEETAFLDERKGELNAELDEVKARIAEAAGQKALYETQLKEKQQEALALRDTIRGKRGELSKAETAGIRAKARMDELSDRKESVEQSLPGMKMTLERLESSLRSTSTDTEKFQSVLQQDEAQLALAEENARGTQAALAELSEKEKSLAGQKQSLEAQLARLQARLDVLKDAEANLSGLNRGVQFIQKQVSQSNEKRIRRTVQSGLLVREGCETAVAAALGEELDGLISDSSEWDFLMDLLGSGNNGRAAFVPKAYPFSAAAAAPSAGLSPLEDLILESDTPEIIHRLLNGAFLAESRQQAISCQPMLGPGQRIVTRSGDVFKANGTIISGNEGRQQVLSRTREIHDLSASISETGIVLEKLKAASEQLESEHLSLQKQYDAAASEKSRIREAIDQVRKQLNRISLEAEKQRQTMLYQRQRIEEAQKQIDSAAAQIASCKTVIAEQDGIREQLQAEIRSLQDQMNRIQLNELQEQVQHWSVSLAVQQKSELETNKRILENEDAIVKNRTKLTAGQNRIYSLEKQLNEIGEQKEELQSESESFRAQAAQINEGIAPAEVLLKESDERFSKAQTEYNAYQQHVSSSERLLAQAQLEVTRQDDRLESLKKHIEDDFGLVNFSFSERVSGQGTLPLGEMVAELPEVPELNEELEEQVQQRKNHLRRMGAVNTEAVSEYREASERYTFLTTQMDDLKKADADLREVIARLDEMMENAFLTTFEKVRKEFTIMFSRLFNGGSAKLVLTDPDNVNRSGIEIEAKLPGHREQELSLLSGGERSLTSAALVFALLRVSPTPFCILDEVDAALDEANVGRFCDLLKELSADTQFLVITHNRNTVEASDVIYGITMSSDSTSQVVSLKLDEVSNKEYLK